MDDKDNSISREREKSLERTIDERVHQQLVYKDNRIIDLNNVILDKERQILDLQERVREHNEVASVKNQAMRIVQQKFEEMNRDKKDMSTETESSLLTYSASTSSSSPGAKNERRTRSSSPGHVIAQRKSIPTSSSGTFSPPPLDPPFDSSHSKLSALPDIDGINRKQHQRKRVTFDLNPNASPSLLRIPHNFSTASTATSSDGLESALTEASSENAVLRQQIVDLNAAVEKMKSDYEAEVVKYTKEAKTAGLKAKVAATARIKELEACLEEINEKHQDEAERLREEVSTLRSSRDWEIEQNGQLRDQVSHLKEKVYKLTEELDASEKAKRSLDTEIEESKKLMELMVDDLLQAENAINYHQNQKEAIFEDIDRLKEAIQAQDRFIEILEADIVIYEQHIGLLRENLGASKVDHRALIKSKAFETKLHALEREKEQSDKKSNEDRLKTKALDKKCRVLVEQNEKLMARLCELEMSQEGADEAREHRLAEQDERIRQVTSALESERDVSQRLREAKETLERELLAKRKQEEMSGNRYQRDVEMARMEAQNKIDEMAVEVEAARRKVTEVMAEVEQLRATNFDLQMHIETAKRTMEELADENEKLEMRMEEVEELNEEKEEDLKQSTWDVETLTRQNEALRVELDGVRQGFQETRELSEEVKQLKAELQRQQEAHRAQFEAACRQLVNEDIPERKTSLEVQQEQFILAFEEKIKDMNIEMDALRKELEFKNAPVQRKTTAVLEPPNVSKMQEIQQMQKIQMQQSAPEELLGTHQYPISAPYPPVTSTETSESKAPEVIEALNLEIEALKKKNAHFQEIMERLEMESQLSGELNVELGRAMLELEEKNELLMKERIAVETDGLGTKRELELHVIIVNELTDQVASMQENIDELKESKCELQREVAKCKMEAASAACETQRLNSEVERLLRNLSESEIARKEEFEKANTHHDAEIRKFSIKMEDARRDIADLEAKLQEAERMLLDAQVQKVQETPVLQETHILTSSSPVAPEDTGVTTSELTSEIFPETGSLFSEPVYSAPETSEVIIPSDEEAFINTVSQDMSKLIELKDELEIAVQALKAEIWSLNGQLKASILDREGLEDKVVELDGLLEKEKKRAISLDVELQEQVDLTDRAVRRAAEAENESNQRMAECLEKETRREEIENAYTRLNEYYNQLQEAYNNVYAQLATIQASQQDATPVEPVTSTAVLLSSSDADSIEVDRIVDGIMTVLLISRDPSISLNTKQKLEKVAGKLKQLLEEYGENQEALEEQRKITEALEQRLQTVETARNSDEVTTTRERVEQLEGEVEWKEEECEGLKRRIRELEKALGAVAERADESEAAKLTTRQADVDSLFRTNAELAHTNVRLQNEVDEMEEWKVKNIEEREQLEQHVKELEEQVAELMEQHEMHLQQAQRLQSMSPVPQQESTALEESQREIQRLSVIEQTLNTRILALEDQNLELEEKYQEIEDEMMEMKREVANNAGKAAQNTESWNSGEDKEELEQAKSEVERLLNVEKALAIRLEMLQIQNSQLEVRIKEQEGASQITAHSHQSSKPAEDDDDWGWGEKEETTASTSRTVPTAETQEEGDDWGWEESKDLHSKKSTSHPASETENELLQAKSEIDRLSGIEKVLNNRILALEDQNLELEERLQDLEDELIDEKEKRKEIESENKKIIELSEKKETKPEEDTWGEWGDEDNVYDAAPEPVDHTGIIVKLQKTISDLQDSVKIQKEVIENAEGKFAETLEKYDELEEAYEQVRLSHIPCQSRFEQLEQLTSELEQIQLENKELTLNLEKIQNVNVVLDERIRELEAEKKQEKEDGGWSDDGWGDDTEKQETKEEKEESDELLQIRKSHEELIERIARLESEKSLQQVEMTDKLQRVESVKIQIERLLYNTKQELDDVKTTLLRKEAELTAVKLASEAANAATSSAWNNNDAWKDDGELEQMKQTRSVLEMKVEALQEELMNVKEREQELIEVNSSLKASIETLESQLHDTKEKLASAEAIASDATASSWNDDNDWNAEVQQSNNEADEQQRLLQMELEQRNETIERLKIQIAELRAELIAASESSDLAVLEELEKVKNELRMVSDQNGLLKDSEARLLEHADEFANQMELYQEKCAKLTLRIREMEDEIQKAKQEEQQKRNTELASLRQQLSNAQQEIRTQNVTISDREGLIKEHKRQILEHTQVIDDLQSKIRILSTARRANAPAPSRLSTSSNSANALQHHHQAPPQSSRPSSRLSTSSRVSNATSSSFVPEAMPVPLHSIGSAFDVVVPQSGEPLRRRNK